MSGAVDEAARDWTAQRRAVDIQEMCVRSRSLGLTRQWSGLAAVFALASMLPALAACDPRPQLAEPLVLRSPFPQAQVWAVAPFSNESGVSSADGSRVADQFVKAVEESNGLSCVALNRTLATMQMLRMRAVLTDADAERLRQAMGVDALVLGTITSWDPYPPPKMALAAQVYLRPEIAIPASGQGAPAGAPAAAASGSFDASNHAVIAALRKFSAARHEPGASYGEGIYLVDMGRFSEFACHEVLAQLLGKMAPPPER